MAAIFDRNSEQGFVFASMIEFFQCWSSKQEAALSIQCKQGRASLNFTCSLGEPDQQHVEVKKVFKRRKKKSPSQIKRDNSRAAARAREEAARAPPPPGPPAPTPGSSPATRPSTAEHSASAWVVLAFLCDVFASVSIPRCGCCGPRVRPPEWCGQQQQQQLLQPLREEEEAGCSKL